MGFEKNRAGKFPKNCKLKPNLKIQADGCLPAGAADLTNPGIASPRRHVFCSGCKCMNFIVTLFLQNHRFFKKQPFFSSFSRKNNRFSPHTPENFSHFSKNSLIFHEKSPKYIFSFFSKTSRNKDHFSTIQPHRRQHPRRAVRKCGGRRNPEKFRCTVIFVTISCYNSVINL